MKFTPLACASATMACASARPVWSPNIIVPRHNRDTSRLLLPSRRYCMDAAPWGVSLTAPRRAGGRARPGGARERRRDRRERLAFARLPHHVALAGDHADHLGQLAADAHVGMADAAVEVQRVAAAQS